MAVADTLRTELKQLRAGEGRTLIKLQACPALREALANPRDADLMDRFDAAVLALGNDLKSIALKRAFALGLPNPGNLTMRRENFGAEPAVDRGPDTVKNWEDERLEELVARLLAGSALPAAGGQLLVIVAIEAGRIVTVAEGMSGRSDVPERHWFNPELEPFLPGFIYRIPPYAAPDRLTVCAVFMDEAPERLEAAASADLLSVVCGDSRQLLRLNEGNFGDIEAICHAAVNYNTPAHGVYYAFRWA